MTVGLTVVASINDLGDLSKSDAWREDDQRTCNETIVAMGKRSAMFSKQVGSLVTIS